jgi:ADP-heptose:LPS heptosyltransferase
MNDSPPRAFIFKNFLCPGDVLVMTAALYSLHRQHPGKFLTAVETTCPALWEFNPDIASIEEARAAQAEEVQMHYNLIHQCNQRAVHMMDGYCDHLEQNLRVRVPLLTNKPKLYLSEQEKSWLPQVDEALGRKQPYWVICAGRKTDFTAKFWGTDNYQKVVDQLRGRVLFVQIGEQGHHHPPLKNVLNLVGKTDTRQLVRLCHHAEGGVGGTTFLMHLMATFEKPYMCVLGGREPVQWNSYPHQTIFHTMGMLPCCKKDSCWKSRTVRLNDGANEDASVCDSPVLGDEPIPKCLAMIRPEEVVETIGKFST